MTTPLQILPSEYHAKLGLDRGNVFSPDSYLSKSTVFELYQSSLYKWRFYPRQFNTTAAMSWGSLVDCLVTSPDDFDNQFVVSPFDSFRTKEAKEWKAETLESGAEIVTEDLINEANKAADVLTSKHKFAASIIEKSASQVVLLNRVKHSASEKPVNLKALLDFAPEGEDYLVDLKTTADFTASGFEKTIAKFGYHVQAAHYLAMHNLQNPDDQRNRFLIIWQDSKPPYEVAVTEIPEADIADGSDMFDHLLGKIIRAAEKDWWPMKFTEPFILGRAAFGVYADESEMHGHTPTI